MRPIRRARRLRAGSWQGILPSGPRPHEPLTLERAAQANMWLAVDGVTEAQPEQADPVQGQRLLLSF